MNYAGLKCPVCGKVFTADDDVVVCPQCGAPYHRECYAREGHCIYEDRHGTPDAWKAPEKETKAAAEKRCPRCGAPNPKDALFCAHCGLPLSEDGEQQTAQFPEGAPSANQQGPQQENPNFPPNFGFPGQQLPILFDPLGGVSPDEPVENVPAGDLAKYIQENTQYYIPLFVDATHFGRRRFNFAAFLFQGIWMLFRKLYRVGAVIAAVQGGLMLSYFLLMKYCVLPLYENLYSLAGITIGGYGTITAEQRQKLVELISVMPAWQQWAAVSPLLYLIASLALMIVCGVIGNRLYLKHCLSEVRRIHNETPVPADFSVRLQREGGVNTSVAAVFAFCLTLVYFFALL
jgi:hypothetical protein